MSKKAPRTAFGRKEQIPTRPSADAKDKFVNAGDLSHADICKHLGISPAKKSK